MVSPPAHRVVVIGASTGGVRTGIELVARLDADFPAPIFWVQHIGAHRSQLARLMQARCRNTVCVPVNGEKPRPGHIYVAPPDQHMTLEGETVRLSRGPKEHHTRPAIDPLFRSAALSYGAGVIGVVLTGALDDGTSGLAAIKDCGGIAVVQHPDDAEEPSMPKSAVTHVNVDHIVAAQDIPALLLRLVSEPAPPRVEPSAPVAKEQAVSLGDEPIVNLRAIADPSAFSCPDCGGVLFELQDKRPVRYRCHTGHAFSLRSLASTQDEVTDLALWGGIRALQEKQMILRRMADAAPTELPDKQLHLLQQADELEQVGELLRQLTISREGGKHAQA